jgi:hypothetical protein
MEKQGRRRELGNIEKVEIKREGGEQENRGRER